MMPARAGISGSATASEVIWERRAPRSDIVDSRSSWRRAGRDAEAAARVEAGMISRAVARAARVLYMVSRPSSAGSGLGGIWKNIQVPAATVRNSVAHAKNAAATSTELAEVSDLRPR